MKLFCFKFAEPYDGNDEFVVADSLASAEYSLTTISPEKMVALAYVMKIGGDGSAHRLTVTRPATSLN